jgi:transcriptional repressor NrdR
MRCPYCNEMESRVVDSRSSEDGSSIRRRRECILCHRRFTTYERLEEKPLMVIKRGGIQRRN